MNIECSGKLIGRDNGNQDLNPVGRKINGNYIFIVADGHGGNKTVSKIKSIEKKICDIASRKDTKKAIKFVKNKCKKYEDGAMISIIKFNMNNSVPKIEICWYGDCMTVLYDKNKNIIFKTNTQDLSDNDMTYTSNQIIDMGFEIAFNEKKFKPTIDERKFELDSSFYFRKQTKSVSTYGHVGNLGICNVEPGYFETKFEEGMKIISGSDGIWDVIHPECQFIKDTKSAKDLAKYALKRWHDEYDFYKYNNIVMKKRKIAETDDQRDDISVVIASF